MYSSRTRVLILRTWTRTRTPWLGDGPKFSGFWLSTVGLWLGINWAILLQLSVSTIRCNNMLSLSCYLCYYCNYVLRLWQVYQIFDILSDLDVWTWTRTMWTRLHHCIAYLISFHRPFLSSSILSSFDLTTPRSINQSINHFLPGSIKVEG